MCGWLMTDEKICSVASERAVLAGMLKHGADAFIDVDGIIDTGCFVFEENAIIYPCLKHVLENSSVADLPSVLSAAQSLNLDSAFRDKVPNNYIKALMNFDIKLENVRNHAAKLRRLQVARDIRLRARKVISDISDVTGDETIDKLISIGESPFFELSTTLNSSVQD